MSKAELVLAISAELSSDVATAILTKQAELQREPRELLDIVLAVHSTLTDLSSRVQESRFEKITRSRLR
jgi:hypothetical protein